MESSLIGTRLSKYEIQAEIGRGGMGVVYRGYDPLLDRYVAIKVLAPHLVWQQEFVERFLREARAAARLKHPNIVTIHDVGQQGGRYYFVMEYLEGRTLADVIRQRGPLPPKDVLSILRPLAGALDYAHHRGLVHRDIKSGNIIVGPEGLATLTDFGIVRAAQETRLTATGTIVGTPEYMSPEQAKGLAVDARSDQYSLAVVAYEGLSGRVPFEAESTLALLHKIVYDPPPPIRQARPDLPVHVEDVLAKALAKEPGSRYAQVSAFVDALGRALAGEEAHAVPARPGVTPPPVRPAPPAVVPVPKPAPTRRRVPVWAWALGGLAVLVLVGIVGIGGGGGDPTPTPPAGETATLVVLEEMEETARPSPSPAPTATATRRPTRTPSPTTEATATLRPRLKATSTPTTTPAHTPSPTVKATATLRLRSTATPTPAPPTAVPPTQPPPTEEPPPPPPPDEEEPPPPPPPTEPPPPPPPTEPPPP